MDSSNPRGQGLKLHTTGANGGGKYDSSGAAADPSDYRVYTRLTRQRKRDTGWSRREFLWLVRGAAVGTAFAFVGFLPPASRAFATHLTPKPLSEGCFGPDRTGDSYSGTTGCCACGSSVSAIYCGSDNWHKHHSEHRYYYALRLTSCTGEKPDGTWAAGKNAWLWTRSGTVWRCSDGTRIYCGDTCGDPVNTVCPKAL